MGWHLWITKPWHRQWSHDGADFVQWAQDHSHQDPAFWREQHCPSSFCCSMTSSQHHPLQWRGLGTEQMSARQLERITDLWAKQKVNEYEILQYCLTNTLFNNIANPGTTYTNTELGWIYTTCFRNAPNLRESTVRTMITMLINAKNHTSKHIWTCRNPYSTHDTFINVAIVILQRPSNAQHNQYQCTTRANISKLHNKIDSLAEYNTYGHETQSLIFEQSLPHYNHWIADIFWLSVIAKQTPELITSDI